MSERKIHLKEGEYTRCGMDGRMVATFSRVTCLRCRMLARLDHHP